MLILTENKIKKYYKIFNEKYFENKLPRCLIRIKHSFRYVGCFEFRPSKQKYGKPTGLCMFFTDVIEWSEELFKNVLMHEMIHCYVAYCKPKKKKYEEHDEDFHEMMQYINKTYGFNVVITSDINELKPAKNVSSLRWWLFKKFS
jgi:hypothetical protein